MHEIDRERLWIGSQCETRDVAKVLNLGVQAVVDLALEELPIQFPREIAYLRIPLIDGEGNEDFRLELAVSSVATLISAQVPTLVACGAGLSRSPAIVAAAWSRAHALSLNDALREIARRVPHDISPALWNELQRRSSAPA